jgi:hypothetical protein
MHVSPVAVLNSQYQAQQLCNCKRAAQLRDRVDVQQCLAMRRPYQHAAYAAARITASETGTLIVLALLTFTVSCSRHKNTTQLEGPYIINWACADHFDTASRQGAYQRV